MITLNTTIKQNDNIIFSSKDIFSKVSNAKKSIERRISGICTYGNRLKTIRKENRNKKQFIEVVSPSGAETQYTFIILTN